MSSEIRDLAAASSLRESLVRGPGRRLTGQEALQLAVRIWFSVTLIGQALFVIHIVGFYGRALLTGNYAEMNKMMPVGHVPGDGIGNVTLGLHLMAAAVLSFLGVLQLWPRIRARALAFHRWSGRLYVSMALIGALTALYLSMIRGHQPGTPLHHKITELNAVLIILFASLALRHARARDFGAHRRWALRLFLVVSGVFFFRIEVFSWLFAVGPVGFDPETFQGPALVVFGFLQYALPLALLEGYFRSQRAGGVPKFAMATALTLASVVMIIGIFSFGMFVISEGIAV
jgi:uncharacterized membrane protein